MEAQVLFRALDAVVDGVVVVDVQQSELPIIYANKPFARFNQGAAADIIGQNCRILQEHAQNLTSGQDITQIIQERREGRVLLYRTPSDSTPGWYELLLSPLANDTGQVTHYVIVQTDVTERFRNQREILFTQVALNNARETIFIIDAQGMILQANQIALDRLEYTVGEFQTMHFCDLDPTCPREMWPARWEQIRVQKSVTIESVNRSKSGREFPVEIISTTFTFGHEAYCCAFVRDLTRRKLAEKALKANEAYLQAIIENLPFDLWAKDVNDIFTFQNQLSKKRWGNLIGQRTIQAHISPEMLAEWQIEDRRALSGEVVHQDVIYEENGVARHFKKILAPVWSEGQIIGTVGVNVDITEQVMAQEALRQSEERYRVISELTTDFAYSYRLEPSGLGIQEWITDAFTKITGYQPEDVLTSKQWWRLTHPEERPSLREAQASVARGESGVWEYRIFAKDGRTLWLRFFARPIMDEATGRVVRIYGAAQDITQVKQLEEQLFQARKMEAVGLLAGGVAHDFNNLLTVILSYGDLLMVQAGQATPNGAMIGRWGKAIKEAAQNAAALTQQLLAFGRRQLLKPSLISLNQTIIHMADMLYRLIPENIQLHTHLAHDLGYVRADPMQMEQVILNLVVNARDAMPQGGSITLETDNVELDEAHQWQYVDVIPGRYVLLAVSDTGTGMDTRTMERIFEPFFTTKAQGKGTGLGLATVHGIIKQSEGHIWVSSEPGQGTVFKAYLPRVDEIVSPVEVESQPKISVYGQGTVLLVEDEEMVRVLAQDVLNLHGYQVLVADSVTAEEICRTYEGVIDLLLTDVVMPVISGRELAEKLVLLRPRMKVLYMSGYTDKIIVHHGVLNPGIAFLQKPFTPDGLIRQVRAVLDERPD